MDRRPPIEGRPASTQREDCATAKRRREDPDVLHRKAQIAILAGLATGEDDVFELLSRSGRTDVRSHFTPDVAALGVAAAALGLACPPGSEPLGYEGVVPRCCDKISRGRGPACPSTQDLSPTIRSVVAPRPVTNA